MKIENIPFMMTDWSKIDPQIVKGETGYSSVKTHEQGNIRTRYVEYSNNYMADHWCKIGHVVFILDGEIKIEIDDGRSFILRKGMSFMVADDIDAHKASSEFGAIAFIVD
jgi:hypothetical protein